MDTKQEDQRWNRDMNICVMTSTLLFALYAKCLYPSVSGGDSGELTVSAHELGVAHPPGYPLFTLLAKMIMVMLPVGSPAWRVNLLTALFSAMAGGLLQFTVLRITGCVGSSLLSVGLFSLSKLTWSWSVTAEVFALNNLLLAAVMCLAVCFEMDDDPFHVEKMITGKLLLKLSASLMLGLTAYLYLPLSCHLSAARWTWGDQQSFEGFLTHLLRREYGTFDLGKGLSGLGFLSGLQSYWEHAHQDLCELGPFLALVGMAVAVVWRCRNEGTSLLVFAVMFILYSVLFAWRANLDISNPLFRGVVERFWLQSDLVLSVLAGVGYYMAVRLLTERILGNKQLPMSAIFATMGACIVILMQLKNILVCDHSKNFVVHDFAKSLLGSFPPNALILSKGDLPTNSMRYFHLVENTRQDLQLLDVEVMTYSWFLPQMRKHFPRVTFPGDFWNLQNRQWPDGRSSFNFKSFLDHNFKNFPIFACIGMQERDRSWQQSYITLPFGPCVKLEQHNHAFNPSYWANYTGGLADSWTYPHDGFEETSWEKVANDEMWQAKIGTAFFMYQQAQQLSEGNAKTQLLVKSYELYFRAIKLNQVPGKLSAKEGFPHFWYKNFALVCEKLLHCDHNIDKAKLCKLAMSNFKQYIYLEPSDADNGKIRDALEILEQRLHTIVKLDSVDKHLENMANRIDRMGVADLMGNIS